jgi:LemA protein
MIFVLIIIAVIVAWIIVTYNNLVQARNKVRNSFAQVDTQLQRRFDLIPNLVETVKGYALHENNVLEKITSARSGYMNAQTAGEKMEADNQLTSTLKTLFAVAENYPELKANTNFLHLQDELRATEDKVAFSRQFFNDSVTMYNNSLQLFPSNIIAKLFGFQEEGLFKTEDAARVAPKVQF